MITKQGRCFNVDEKDQLLNDIEELILLSQYYIYDNIDEYKKHIDNMHKLYKNLEKNKIHKCVKKDCEL